MKIKLLAVMLTLGSSSAFCNGVLFNILYAGKPINVPITLCLDGITPSSCETQDVYKRQVVVEVLLPQLLAETELLEWL